MEEKTLDTDGHLADQVAAEEERQKDRGSQAPWDIVTVTITRIGQAFADDPVLQTNLCLAAVAMQLIEDPSRTEGVLFDVNGNSCGSWKIGAI